MWLMCKISFARLDIKQKREKKGTFLEERKTSFHKLSLSFSLRTTVITFCRTIPSRNRTSETWLRLLRRVVPVIPSYFSSFLSLSSLHSHLRRCGEKKWGPENTAEHLQRRSQELFGILGETFQPLGRRVLLGVLGGRRMGGERVFLFNN